MASLVGFISMRWSLGTAKEYLMKRSMTLTLELSEKRERVNALLGKAENLTTEERGEMDVATKRIQEIEPELRASIVAEDGEEEKIRQGFGADAEGRELREMLDQASVGKIFEAACEHRSVGGVEDELQKQFKVAANQIPLEMLRGREARAVTPAPASTGASQQPIIPPVFAEGDAAFLNVSMPTVPVGDAVFPVLSTRATVGGPHKNSTSVDETTGAFTADALSPGRLQASFVYRRSDAGRMASMGEALRMALSSGLSEAMDKEVIDQIVTDVAQTPALSAEGSFATYRSRFIYGQLEGRYAPTESDIRVLGGASTIAHMALQYRAATADDSVLDSLRRVSGGVRVSAHIAVVASKKQDAIIRRGSRMDAVAPIWEGITILDDQITKAATGEIVVTAILLAAFKVVRPAGFARVETQVAP